LAAEIMRPSFRRIPWVTAVVTVLAVAAWMTPALSETWVYDRNAILRGQIWRLWTGNLVHFSISHLAWNLLVVVLTGVWIEWAGFRGGRRLWLIAPPCVGLALLVGEPSLIRYGGLSGLAVAAVTFACLSEWREEGSQKLIWSAMLSLVGVKIGWEFYSGESIFAHFAGVNVRVEPLSHLAGVVAAGFCYWRFHSYSAAKTPKQSAPALP
jgi:rhomboid family GlyGly-CTERM serine protease